MGGILLGLVSALSFGTADFFAGRASRKAGVFSTLFYMQFAGFLLLTAVVTWQGQWHGLRAYEQVASASLWMALDLVGILLLYQGLVSGKASVVAPIASSFSVFTVFLAMQFGDERLSVISLAAVALTLGGVLLTTLVLTKRRKGIGNKLESGAVWAIFAALFLGTAFYGLRYPQETIGELLTVWIGRLQATVLLPIVYTCFNKRIMLPDIRHAGLISVVGILDAMAIVSYNFGLGLENTSIVITATSLFAVVTLLWGVLLDGEQPAWNQWLGVGCTFLGILMISLNS